MKLNNNDDSHNSGLNLLIYNMLLDIESHPTWVCGLKLRCGWIRTSPFRHTLRGCVDWNSDTAKNYIFQVGHTLRGCVDWNAFYFCINLLQHFVTPYVGVWIETDILLEDRARQYVTPYVGVWIETLSRPDYPSGSISHTLRGCVDWNFDYLFYFCFHKVTPCVGIYGLEHCSLVGQVYGRTVSIRPLMYFSPGFWFCYDWKKHVQARMLIFCLFSFVVSPRWQYIGT